MSLAAASMLRSRSNCTTTVVVPSPLEDVVCETPGICANWRSNGCATDEAMVAALRRKGTPVGYFLFSGEQHGFRKAANIQRCLDAELNFYAIEVFRTGLTF